MVKLRFVQRFREEHRDKFLTYEAQFAKLERENSDFPKGRRYLAVTGREPTNTLIWECGSELSGLKVGLCQVETQPWDVENNLKKTLEALELAADEEAVLAITPECVLHGYPDFSNEDDILRMHLTAEPLDGIVLGQIRDLARRRKMNIIIGFAEKGSDDRVHNSAAYIDSHGDFAAVYRKVHCRDFESAWYSGAYTPGDSFEIVDIEHRGHSYRVGLIICFDREIPESIRCVRAMGAHLVVCPLATDTFDMYGNGTEINNEVITRCRAVENEVFIAVVNHSLRFNGGSYIVSPRGECIARMDAHAGVTVVEIPTWEAPVMHRDTLSWMGWGFRRPSV